jgi:predicted nucleotidyltransferase
MSILAEILSSRARAEIFRLLFFGTVTELHVREIERRSGFNDRTVRQELTRLKRLDLVKDRKSGNRVYYSANREHPLYSTIRNLVMKTVGLVDVLRAALTDKRIRLAFVFGSLARDEEKAESDVDLMVIGSLGLRTLSGLLAGVSDKIEREINPHVFTEEEFLKRIKDRDHFITSVLQSEKIFIIGNEHEFETMVG